MAELLRIRQGYTCNKHAVLGNLCLDSDILLEVIFYIAAIGILESY